MSIKNLIPAKVLHLRISFQGVKGAMEEVKLQPDRVSHAFDYDRSGKHVVLSHERNECCSWCDKVEDYSTYLV